MGDASIKIDGTESQSNGKVPKLGEEVDIEEEETSRGYFNPLNLKFCFRLLSICCFVCCPGDQLGISKRFGDGDFSSPPVVLVLEINVNNYTDIRTVGEAEEEDHER